uniref:EF-hand domain-containing protein n=1 Tax=Hemiselmis tepida TaxID=464990 RepID=A0A7S0W4D5_9CRYP
MSVRPGTGMSGYSGNGGDPPVPFLPGNSFADPNKDNFRKSHAFDYRSGTPVEMDVPAKMDTTIPSRPQSTQQRFRQSGQQDAEFVPAFAGLDGKVLRFDAFTAEQVPENLTEPFRVRMFTILYHLVDDSVQINEHKQQNSGHAQGVFMKRHRVPRKDPKPGEEFVSLFDFADTKTVQLYSRDFHLTGCNDFTQQFYEVNGMSLQFETHIPEDKYMTMRLATASRSGRNTATPGPGDESMEMGGFRPDSQASMSSMTSVAGGTKRDMREKFLKYANKVLRFYGQWDDRGSMFGQKLEYVINYFLQDDKVEVLEVKRNNSGRDPFPKLVKKQRIPRSFRGVPSVGSKESDFEDQYINDQDLLVGTTIEVFGRDMFLYDCDDFTRDYYRQQYGIEQSGNLLQPDALVEFPSMPLPPYNGFGSEHDSLASYFNLIPKPRRYDAGKQATLDAIIFRWKAKFDMDKMTAPNPDDHKRRFVVSYFMGDGSVSIYEPPIQNSGFMGGKFLERQRVIKHNSPEGFGDWMTDQDLLIDLPGTVWINGYPFVLLETDKFTLRYVNKGNIDSFVNVDTIHRKICNKFTGTKREILNVFRMLDEEKNGVVTLDDLVNVIRKFNFELDEDEMIALMARWDQAKEGVINYEKFVDTVF